MAPGTAYAGGFFAGQISTAGNGIADYNLVVAPVASGEATNKQFNTMVQSDPTSVIDGPANSATMNNANQQASFFCNALTIGGYSDWYSPAKNELEVCYYNLKPGTATNNTASGANPNAVPARASNYTLGNPAQTAATAFQTGNSEAYIQDYYWCSTQIDTVFAWLTFFYRGTQRTDYSKQSPYRIRAIRRVAV
tara:strand:+ start:3144 stop:3725 length:582 start_codon:yes stop_codon:yes gene_type:complete